MWGWLHLYEIVQQLRGDAGERQVARAPPPRCTPRRRDTGASARPSSACADAPRQDVYTGSVVSARTASRSR